jgi:hypothetical protein
MLYRILLFVHVLAAASWAGAAVYSFLMALNIRASGEPMRMASFAREARDFGRKYFAPVALITVLAGIWLTIEGDVGFDHFWIQSAFAVWIYSIVSNVTWMPRLMERIGSLTQERGPTDPDVVAAGRTMFMWRSFEVLLLVYVVFAMTYKPLT